MTIPLEITFRDMDPSPALEDTIREKVAKLALLSDRIVRCEVVLDRPHQHHHQGQHVRVHLRLEIPGNDIIVSRDPDLDATHENAYAAVRDAFVAARSQLAHGPLAQRRDHG